MASGAGGVNSGAFTGASSPFSNTSAAASSGGSWNARLKTHSKAQLKVAASPNASTRELVLSPSPALRAFSPRVASASRNFRKPNDGARGNDKAAHQAMANGVAGA